MKNTKTKKKTKTKTPTNKQPKPPPNTAQNHKKKHLGKNKGAQTRGTGKRKKDASDSPGITGMEKERKGKVWKVDSR